MKCIHASVQVYCVAQFIGVYDEINQFENENANRNKARAKKNKIKIKTKYELTSHKSTDSVDLTPFLIDEIALKFIALDIVVVVHTNMKDKDEDAKKKYAFKVRSDFTSSYPCAFVTRRRCAVFY